MGLSARGKVSLVSFEWLQFIVAVISHARIQKVLPERVQFFLIALK